MNSLRWAVADGWTVTLRSLDRWVREPGVLLLGLLFPVLMMLMFGYLLGGAMAVPGGDYFEFLMPGMFALAMLFGIESTTIAVATDAARGITDRFRSMPMAPSAVVVGRSVADMLNSALGLGVLMIGGQLVGWHSHGTAAETMLAVALLLLLRFAFLWMGIYIGLVIGKPEGAIALQILVWPFAFVSSTFAAPDTMPGWLGAAAEWNPMSATAVACRDLFGNPTWGEPSWATDHAMLIAVLWPLALIAVFVPLSVRRYQRLSR
ncbi:ABC transporter permease [Virgisporangium aurantiacum]|uniref:Transport permease protein n=1 Tax=Virgisporangium aurantiacum TaxID=175570 RepID=A0A8J3ZE36_9ACTN|nr:ABC transporter permease [Virgisporangium aurantiacum]GIJ59990.1 transport permease protein [Virgisporangium aurantiacum]